MLVPGSLNGEDREEKGSMKEKKNQFSGQIGFVLAAAEARSAWAISGAFRIWRRRTAADCF